MWAYCHWSRSFIRGQRVLFWFHMLMLLTYTNATLQLQTTRTASRGFALVRDGQVITIDIYPNELIPQTLVPGNISDETNEQDTTVFFVLRTEKRAILYGRDRLKEWTIRDITGWRDGNDVVVFSFSRKYRPDAVWHNWIRHWTLPATCWVVVGRNVFVMEYWYCYWGSGSDLCVVFIRSKGWMYVSELPPYPGSWWCLSWYTYLAIFKRSGCLWDVWLDMVTDWRLL